MKNYASLVKVIQDLADKEGHMFSDQLMHLAQLGLECSRIHSKRENHIKQRRLK